MKAFTFVPEKGIVRGIVINDPDGAFIRDPYVYMGNTGAPESKILCSRDFPPVRLFTRWIDGTYKRIAFDVSFYEITLSSSKKQLMIQSSPIEDKRIVIFIPKQYNVALKKDIKGAGLIFKEQELHQLLYLPKWVKEIILILNEESSEIVQLPELAFDT